MSVVKAGPGNDLSRRSIVPRVLACLGLCIGAALLAGCSSNNGQAGVGQDPADVANDVPYGPGAEVGVTYDYSLYVHCGVEWARVDGVWWRTDPLNDGNANPPDGWDNPYHRGELTLREPNVADFQGPEGSVEFERTDIVDTPYECE